MRLRNIPGAKEETKNSPYVIGEPMKMRGHWRDLFGEADVLCLEIGMGKGRFLMEQARLHPENAYIGIEMYDSVLLRALQKRRALEEEGASFPNLYFLCMDARLLPEVFAKDEVDLLYLNFSDPWPKSRHAQRRLTSQTFLSRYEQILKKGGRLEFKTDNGALFDFSLLEAEEAGWQILAFTRDLHAEADMNEGNVMTEYEEKFSSRGNPICKMILKAP